MSSSVALYLIFLKQGLTLSLELMNSGRLVVHCALYLLHAGVTDTGLQLASYWGPELRPSCLDIKYFLHWEPQVQVASFERKSQSGFGMNIHVCMWERVAICIGEYLVCVLAQINTTQSQVLCSQSESSLHISWYDRLLVYNLCSLEITQQYCIY